LFPPFYLFFFHTLTHTPTHIHSHIRTHILNVHGCRATESNQQMSSSHIKQPTSSSAHIYRYHVVSFGTSLARSLARTSFGKDSVLLHSAAMSCSVCSVLKSVALFWNVLQCVTVCLSVLQFITCRQLQICLSFRAVAVRCSVLQCVAVRCRALQCVAELCSMLLCN